MKSQYLKDILQTTHIFGSNIVKSISILCTFQCMKNRAMEQLGVTVSAIGIREIVGPDMVSSTQVVQKIGKLLPIAY